MQAMNGMGSITLESHCPAGTFVGGATHSTNRHCRQPAAAPRTVCMAQQAPARADQGYEVQESETYLGCAFWLVRSNNALRGCRLSDPALATHNVLFSCSPCFRRERRRCGSPLSVHEQVDAFLS